MIQLTIGGVDYTSSVAVPALRLTQTLNSRDVLKFPFRHLTIRPRAGQEVILYETPGGTRRFGGLIKTVRGKKHGAYRTYQVECQSYEGLLDRRLVAAVYVNTAAGGIVKDIITSHVTGEGITTTNVQDGPTITRAVFNYSEASQCLDELAELTGYAWWIDPDKDLHFVDRATDAAPFGLADGGNQWRDLEVEETLEDYRNTQIVRAGLDLTDSRTETFVGDGERRTFTLSLPVGVVPSAITVDAAAKTVGIRGIDTGKNWYWNKSDPIISQDDGGVVLTTGNVLSVTYRGQFPIRVMAQDDAAIAARVAVEGGSGVYAAIADDPNIDSDDMAADKAAAMLRRWGVVPERVTYQTFTSGLRPGQLQSIILTGHDLNGNYLIESIEMTYAGNTDQFEYAVTALSGDGIGGWVDFFRRLAQAGRKYVIRDNEVLILLRSFADSVTCGDSITVATSSPESRIGTAMVGYAEVA